MHKVNWCTTGASAELVVAAVVVGVDVGDEVVGGDVVVVREEEEEDIEGSRRDVWTGDPDAVAAAVLSRHRGRWDAESTSISRDALALPSMSRGVSRAAVAVTGNNDIHGGNVKSELSANYT